VAKKPASTRPEPEPKPASAQTKPAVIDGVGIVQDDSAQRTLTDFLALCQGAENGARVQVWTRSPSGSYMLDPRYRCTADAFDPYKLADVCGGGVYRLRLLNASGQYHIQRDIEIAGEPRPSTPAAPTTPAATPGADLVGTLGAIMERLERIEAARNAPASDPISMLKAAAEILRPPVAAQPTVDQVIAAAKTMTGERARNEDPFAQLMKLEELRMKLRGAAARDDDDDANLAAFAPVLQELIRGGKAAEPAKRPVQNRAPAQRPAQRGPAPGPRSWTGNESGAAPATPAVPDKGETASDAASRALTEAVETVAECFEAGDDPQCAAYAAWAILRRHVTDNMLAMSADQLADFVITQWPNWQQQRAYLVEVLGELKELFNPKGDDASDAKAQNAGAA
jgi:hypothetical protein